MRRNKNLHKKRRAKVLNLKPAMPREKKIIILLAVVVAVMIGVVLVVRPNAYQVQVGDKVLGVVKGKEVPGQSLEVVMASLKEQYKADVRMVTKPEVKKVRASKKKQVTADYLIAQIKDHIEYEIKMVELLVDGKSKGIFRSKAEIDQLIQRIVDKSMPKEIKDLKRITEAKLDAEVDYKSVYVSEDQLSDPDKVYESLTKTKEEGQIYTLVSGDNLWIVAEKNKMEMAELLDLNPGMTEESVLQIGQELNVKIDKPEVSVLIIEEYKIEEEFMQEPIVTEDAQQLVTYRKQISPGKPGIKEVTINTIYKDGLLQETINKEIEVIDQGEAERVVVGTKRV